MGEKRGETLTVRDLRENLKSEIRLDPHHNVALMEYLLWKYQKNLHQLFTPPPEGSVPAHLLEALDKAIEAHNAAVEAERQRQRKIEELSAAEEGAKNELERHTTKKQKEELQGQEFGAAFAAIQARKKKREAEEKRKREESRARLKAKQALWQ